MLQKTKLLAVVGPTAGGKTALSIALAHRLGGEIISCDSMQIYRGMSIGTAKPTAEEMQGIPHHLLDIADPTESFSVNDYVLAAEHAVQDILSRGRLPLFCGGTGLYFDAFLRGEDITETREAVTREESMREYVMLGMRLECGVRDTAFDAFFGEDGAFERLYAVPLRKFAQMGFVRLETHGKDTNYAFTTDGFRVSNYILSEIL